MIKKIIKKIIPKKIWEIIKKNTNIFYMYLGMEKTILPDDIKRKFIKYCANKYKRKIFIETGTLDGGTINEMKEIFEKLFSIEIYEPFFKISQERFINFENIKIIQGDSGKELPKILKDLNEPIFFWLDGHYSGDGTGKGSLETPIIKELDAIFNHSIKNHVILIDDARCFNGKNDYPKIKDLILYIKQKNPNLKLNIKNDIIIIK